MKAKVDTKKLSFKPIADPAALSATTEQLRTADQVALRLVANPTSEGARKTIWQHFAKDRLRPARREPKRMRTKRRGGRPWEHTDAGSVCKPVAIGDICIIPRDQNLIASLPKIRRFVEIAQA